MKLHLHVKAEYFEAIWRGEKTEEYRLRNEYWRKQISRGAPPNQFDRVVIYNGYPKRDDLSRKMTFPYYGFTVRTITHKHFGTKPVEVFAIQLKPHGLF